MPASDRAFHPILIVEDDEERRSWFDQTFVQYQRDKTHEVSLAGRMGEREYVLIFLDHDLAAEHYEYLQAHFSSAIT